MKVVIPSSFVKANQNIKQDDIVQLLNEGTWGVMKGGDGKEKKVLNYQMRIADGDVKSYTMNNTTMRNLISAYGDDDQNWINKDLKAHVVRQMAFGKMTNVLILTPPEWTEPEPPTEIPEVKTEDIPVVEEPKDENPKPKPKGRK